jgi:Tol biopolymer transport system component
MWITAAVLTMVLGGCNWIARSSVSSSGEQANGSSRDAATSGDGRYVAFTSYASNLVADDTNVSNDVFVHDHQTGETSRVSVNSLGVQGLGNSGQPAISADGRYVSFESDAPNLVLGDANNVRDVFLHDRTTGVTIAVSVDTTGDTGNGVSDDPAISADGQSVAFHSHATNLVSDDNNGVEDVFVRDPLGAITRVSVNSDGTQGNLESFNPAISADGRYVAFESGATNLVPSDIDGRPNVFVHQLPTQVTEQVPESRPPRFFGDGPSISGDGRYVAYLRGLSVWVFDRTTGFHDLVSVDLDGPDPDLSGLPSISTDGRYVAFFSLSNDLVPDDNNGNVDVFVRDRTNRRTHRVSLTEFNRERDQDIESGSAAISADGRYVAFWSLSDFVPEDTNNTYDAFLKFALSPRPVRPATGTGTGTTIARGTTAQITITGSWFDPNALQVSIEPSSGVTVDRVAVQDPNTSAVLTITVASDAPTGSRYLVLVNPGNDWNPDASGSAICTDCFTVT